MKAVIVRRYGGVIERPVEEVRAQYCDMRYHVLHNVHTDIRFTIHDVGETTCRFSQEVRLAGMRQIDDIVNTLLPNGDLRSDFTGGMNKGGTLFVRFQRVNANATAVSAELRVPLRGLKVTIAPVLGAAAEAALEKAFAQDKRDLEGGNYARYLSERLADAYS